jgi:hypothetical protein
VVRFLWLVVSVTFLFGYEAKKVTTDEMRQLQVIDNKIYELSVKDVDVDYLQITRFIFLHLNYDIEFVRLKISSSANMRTNSTDTIRDDGTTSRDRNTASIGINLTYPLFDRKEFNNRKKEIIKVKNDVTKNVKNYFKIKFELEELQSEALILEQLEIRDKARKLDGVGGFKDWLNTINKIKQTKFKIGFKKLELIESKQLLLNYIRPGNRTKLKEML